MAHEANSANLQVPVTVSGTPPVIAFDPAYLASVLEIGPTLRLIDGIIRFEGYQGQADLIGGELFALSKRTGAASPSRWFFRLTERPADSN